jgi:cellulose synthase/poly-beta-1,6-N-acetylglucosamine synthase-like glycosyltransferase
MDFLENLSHFFTDLAVLIGWFFHNLFTLFNNFFEPVKWLYVFIKSILSTAFSAPPSVDFGWPVGVIGALNAFPYFSLFVSVALIIFCFYLGFKIFNWIAESL